MNWNDELTFTWENQEQKQKREQDEREARRNKARAEALRTQGYYVEEDDDYRPQPQGHTFAHWLENWWGLLTIPFILVALVAGVYAMDQADEANTRKQIEKNVSTCEEIQFSEIKKFSEVTKCVVNGEAVASWWNSDGSNAEDD